jgi:hypothetical protein
VHACMHAVLKSATAGRGRLRRLTNGSGRWWLSNPIRGGSNYSWEYRIGTIYIYIYIYIYICLFVRSLCELTNLFIAIYVPEVFVLILAFAFILNNRQTFVVLIESNPHR